MLRAEDGRCFPSVALENAHSSVLLYIEVGAMCEEMCIRDSTALAEAGIALYPGARGAADAQVEALLAGTLAYDPDTTCAHHEHHGEGHEGCHGHHGEGHTCGGHCGH